MAKAATKQDLIKQGNEQFKKMWNLIDSMSKEEQNAVFTFDTEAMGKEAHWKRDKNLRDVLIHLYEWHQLFLNWVESNQKGEENPFLPAAYNWKTYGDMNVEFWKKHQNTPYDKSKDIVKESHDKVMQLIETFSNDELFSKGRYKWVGGTTLGQYCTSVTSGHYDWGMKKIKAHKKTLQS